jgi:RNA polymerase sigma-70 factor (ECF subfamily)
MSPRGVTTAGQKKGIFGQVGRKQGNAPRRSGAVGHSCRLSRRQDLRSEALRVRARPIDVMSLAGWGLPLDSRRKRFVARRRSRDHDFVIKSSRRNKLKDRPNYYVGARVREREDEWTDLMRSAISGDDAAYSRLLKVVTPVLRAGARRGLTRAGQPVDQSEDIVQDILLAVHLKRHTWDASAPFAPWLFAIARNKLIDALRRRGRRVFVNIDDFAEILPGEAPAEMASASEVAVHLQSLPARQRDVLQSIAVDSASIKDTAAKFSMTEGAVRVALHRGLTSLTAKLREQ